jgi:phosphopantothenoylcysteine decarboxylase/phosphopantothenate--cysteine ligase
VAAGGTREPVDAVRFIGNYSSGKQGIAFARQAQLLGASVHLVAANVDASELQGLECEEVSTTEQLRTSLLRDLSQFDLVVMAAAVSDYRPEQYLSSKIKRSEVGEKFSLELVANPDILKEITERIRQEGSRTLTIGFAAEASDDLERLGKIKLVTKNCDFIVANDISGGAIFESDDTSVVLVSSEITKAFSGSKASVAKDILLELSTKLGSL